MQLLPEWNGRVVGVMHRMYMTKTALAKEMGLSREYVSRVLNSEDEQSDAMRIKVETALESFAKSRKISFSELWNPKERTRMPQNRI